MKIQEFIDWLEEQKANGATNVSTNSFGYCSITTHGERGNHTTNRCRVQIPDGSDYERETLIDATIDSYCIRTDDGAFKVLVDLKPDTYPDWMDDEDKFTWFYEVDINDLIPVEKY
jgi:hypothetical protein